MSQTRCDIIIPVFNRLALTKKCVESIYINTDTDFNLILIDNASGPETEGYLNLMKAEKPNVTIVRNSENLGWVRAINQGLKISKSRYTCIMNNDTAVKTRGWLFEMMRVAEMDIAIGLVNPEFGTKGSAVRNFPFAEIDFCRGYCILIKRQVIDRIGGLDEAYGFGYYDDDDYSSRAIAAGFRCVRANGVVVEHLRDSTFKDVFRENKRLELHEKNKQLFYSRWGRRLRLVFVVNKPGDRDKIRELLLKVVRRQHIVYLWNASDPFNINHINIRERRLITPLLLIDLLLNRFKKPAKRYDAVFKGDFDPGIIDRIDKLAKA